MLKGLPQLENWARAAGFFAILAVKLGGSLIWALDYPKYYAEWTCKTQNSATEPNSPSGQWVSCRPAQAGELNNSTKSRNNNSNEDSGDGIKMTDKLLVVFTGLLVLVGAFQAYWLRETVDATGVVAKANELAAKAADLSARAAIALQLPIIRVQPGNLGHGESTSGGREIIEDCYVHSITVSNLGDTKAFPKEVLFGWTVGEILPDKPKYRFVAGFPHNCILKPNQIGLILALTGSLILESEQWMKICGGNYLWFYCAVLYEDFMGETRSEGFCWRWSHTGVGLGWRVEKAAAYNKKNAVLSEPPQYP
jgi:hypothetical protein